MSLFHKGKTGLFRRNVADEWMPNLLKWNKISIESIKETKRREYIDRVVSILMAFQMIEDYIRSYINYTYTLIRKCLPESIPFKYKLEDIEKHSLGRLISQFVKLNNNIDLHKELNELIRLRNYYAHVGLLLFKGTKRQVLDQIKWLDENNLKCSREAKRIFDMLNRLTAEFDKFHNIKEK